MGGRKDPQRIDVQTEGGRTKTQTTELMGEEINYNTGSLEVIPDVKGRITLSIG